MAALHQLTAKVHVGAKIWREQQRKAKPLTKLQISAIARRVRDGIMDLPNLDVESNDDYAAVWALIGSGAGKSCANKTKHFPFVETSNRPSQARMATANGQELKSRGTFKVHAMTSEGQVISPEFEDADVDMPIVAVNDISKEDTEVVFRQDQSELVDIETGRKSRFIKKRGVYFMKVYYKRDQCHDEQPGFTRPRAP